MKVRTHVFVCYGYKFCLFLQFGIFCFLSVPTVLYVLLYISHFIVILSMFYQKESYTNIAQIVSVVAWKVSG